jgi:hypothetical protein
MEVRQTMHRKMLEQQVDNTGKYSEGGAAAAAAALRIEVPEARAAQPARNPDMGTTASPPRLHPQRLALAATAKPIRSHFESVGSLVSVDTHSRQVPAPTNAQAAPDPQQAGQRRRTSSIGLGLSVAAQAQAPPSASGPTPAPTTSPTSLFDFLSEHD